MQNRGQPFQNIVDKSSVQRFFNGSITTSFGVCGTTAGTSAATWIAETFVENIAKKTQRDQVCGVGTKMSASMLIDQTFINKMCSPGKVFFVLEACSAGSVNNPKVDIVEVQHFYMNLTTSFEVGDATAEMSIATWIEKTLKRASLSGK